MSPHCNADVEATRPWHVAVAARHSLPACGKAVSIGFSPSAILIGLAALGVVAWLVPDQLRHSKVNYGIFLWVYVMGMMWVAARLEKTE